MVWVPLGQLELDTDWSYTAPVTGQWFRVRHITSTDKYRRGYIAQASTDFTIELHGIRRMYSKSEYDIYQFIQPEPWTARSIAVREYYPSSTNNSWAVQIDVWQTPEEVAHTIEELSKTVDNVFTIVNLIYTLVKLL